MRPGERRVCLFYRVVAFGRPRGPWRTTMAAARRDAIDAGLGSFDDEQRFFLDAVADVETVHEYELMRVGAEYPGSCRKRLGQERLQLRPQA
jgi:hypothetical protein